MEPLETTAAAPPYMEHERRLFQSTVPLEAMLSRITSPETWTALNPQLSLTSHPFAGVREPYAFSPDDLARSVARVKEEGYFQTRPTVPVGLCERLAQGVQNLISAGIHPVFLAAYDEFWQMAASLSPFVAPILGEGYQVLDEFWVFYVDPGKAASGWPPHRDYVSFPGRRGGMRADGRPTVATVWIPVTDATPSNGCMYVLPTNLDPSLPAQPSAEMTPRPGNGVESLQDVRALPAPAGSVLTWNIFLLHWGGRSSRHAPHPRISVGFYFQSRDVEPLSDDAHDLRGELSLGERLARVGQAILSYQNQLPADVVELSRALGRSGRAR